MTTFFVIYLPQEASYGQKEMFLADDRREAIEQAWHKMNEIEAEGFELFEEHNHALQPIAYA